MKIVAATLNENKVREFRQILGPLGFEVITQSEAGLAHVDVDETGTTFAENSEIKARAIHELTGEACLADDSGLMVDALGGAPGVYSARYAGVHGDDAANRLLVLEQMKDVPEGERSARFRTAITLIYKDGSMVQTTGDVCGRIGYEEVGTNGFGYDCIFIPDGYEDTFGVLPAELKNSISHRAAALKKLAEIIERDRD